MRPDWHGWGRGRGPALHIGELPGRKSVCLYTISDGAIRTHAFFKNAHQAQKVMALIDSLVFGPQPAQQASQEADAA